MWSGEAVALNRQSRIRFANIAYLVGFAVGDIEPGAIAEIRRLPPVERTRHWDKAKVGLPHGDHPFAMGSRFVREMALPSESAVKWRVFMV